MRREVGTCIGGRSRELVVVLLLAVATCLAVVLAGPRMRETKEQSDFNRTLRRNGSTPGTRNRLRHFQESTTTPRSGGASGGMRQLGFEPTWRAILTISPSKSFLTERIRGGTLL